MGLISAVTLRSTPIPESEGLMTAPSHRPATVVLRSLGQQMLLQVQQPLGEMATAIGTGVSRASISQWRTGTFRPDDRRRRVLERVYGIPFDAWGAAPVPAAELPPIARSSAPTPPAPEANPLISFTAPSNPPHESAAAKLAPAPPEPDPEPEALQGPAPSVLDDYDALLNVLRRQLQQPTLTPRERAQLTDAMTRAVTQKAKVEREKAMLEDATIRNHPKWKAMKQLLVEALLPYPEAARAVEAAVLRALGEETDDG